jgi:hypothetical protein
MSATVQLRNPYLDAFSRYVMPGGWNGWRSWNERSDWTPEDGYKGPAWDRHMTAMLNTSMARHYLVERFAWAVPSDEAIRTIAGLGSIVEIGAGTGYWASLLELAGADIAAFDKAPAGNHWIADDCQWTKARINGHEFPLWVQCTKRARAHTPYWRVDHQPRITTPPSAR